MHHCHISPGAGQVSQYLLQHIQLAEDGEEQYCFFGEEREEAGRLETSSNNCDRTGFRDGRLVRIRNSSSALLSLAGSESSSRVVGGGMSAGGVVSPLSK